jgi:outer membrane lipase/esterase
MNLKLIGRLAAAATLALAAAAPAAAYSSLVIFGDSLSDSGNNALAIGTDPDQVISGNGYVPTFAYASGTYSDGEVWSTRLATSLGLQADPSRAGGTNWAHGGAETRGNAFPPSLRTQVVDYLGTTPGDTGDALYVIAGGGNNARSALDRISGGAGIVLTIAQTASRYAEDVGLMVDQLQAAGAEHIVVWNTPDVGLSPAALASGSDAAALASLLALKMNDALATRLQGEAGVVTFDVSGLMHSVVADPAFYGLANVTDACGAIVGCDPGSFLFWDGIHPTSAGHALVADRMFAAVVPEPASWALMGAGVAVLVVRRRRGAQPSASAGAASSRSMSAGVL